MSFSNFKVEARDLSGAEDAIYKMSEEFSNVVLISGEIVGKDTEEQLRELARNHGLIMMADNLSILYR